MLYVSFFCCVRYLNNTFCRIEECYERVQRDFHDELYTFRFSEFSLLTSNLAFHEQEKRWVSTTIRTSYNFGRLGKQFVRLGKSSS